MLLFNNMLMCILVVLSTPSKAENFFSNKLQAGKLGGGGESHMDFQTFLSHRHSGQILWWGICDWQAGAEKLDKAQSPGPSTCLHCQCELAKAVFQHDT